MARRHLAVLAVAAVGSLAATLVLTGPAATASNGNNGNITYQVHPHMVQYTHNSAVPAAFPPPSVCEAQYGLACYTPSEIRTAYDVPSSYLGQGEKIAIIDAYGSPTVASDLQTFDQEFGLPPADFHQYCSPACPKTQTAHKSIPADWAGETSLDTQWAHAIAPDAQINLVVANNPGGDALNHAVQYAIDHNLGDVITMSYGTPESAIHGNGNNIQLKQLHSLFQEASAKGISLFASAGDSGATDGSSGVSANYPASDPLVTGVGGTDLFTADNGTYESEYTWNDSDPATCPFGCTQGIFGATGGAPSTVFPAPSYQQGVTGNAMRTVSDVSYNASVYTAVMVYVGYQKDPTNNGFYFFGGTSSGSPQWAALGSLADQAAGHRLGQLNPRLYALAANPTTDAADFHDVTVGNNRLPYPSAPGFNAGTGYDLPTGLGSPDAAHLIASLAGQ